MRHIFEREELLLSRLVSAEAVELPLGCHLEGERQPPRPSTASPHPPPPSRDVSPHRSSRWGGLDTQTWSKHGPCNFCWLSENNKGFDWRQRQLLHTDPSADSSKIPQVGILLGAYYSLKRCY